MRESKDHSDQSTRDDLSKYLSICSQRSLNSTHKLFTTANVKILALVEQNSKSTITFKYSSTGNQNYQSKDDMDGWIKWTDLLSSLLTTDESVSTYGYDLEPWITEAINIDTGAFISDLCRVYSQSVWEFISDACLLEDGSSERAEYLHSALQAPAGLLTHSSSKQSNSHNSSSFAKSSSSDYNNSDLNARLTTQAVNESSQPSSNFTEAMTLLKSMFPTYGDLFIGACLQVFDGNAERAVDAILADNLPLELLSVDRSLKSAWVGKGGEDYVAVKVGAQGKTGDEVYALEDDLNVKAAVKTRMTQERQQWEQSLRIIQREYDDDYDDQFDDAIAYKSSAQLKPIVEESLNPNTRSWQHSQHQQHSVRGGGDTDWNTRMAEMKLLNQLTREDEQEVQYWKNMRNTNHDKAIASSSQAWKASGDDSDVQPLDNNSGATSNVAINKGNVPSTGTQQRRPQDNTKQPQRVNTQPKKLPNNTSKEKKGESAHSAAKDTAEPTDQSGASGSSSHQSNHRHKTFDKHHQKERASRKMI